MQKKSTPQTQAYDADFKLVLHKEFSGKKTVCVWTELSYTSSRIDLMIHDHTLTNVYTSQNGLTMDNLNKVEQT